MKNELFGDLQGDKEPVQYRPLAYLEGRSTAGRLARAIQQCPSPWHYAARVQDIVNIEKRTRT